MFTVRPAMSGSRFLFWGIVPLGAFMLATLTIWSSGNARLFVLGFDLIFLIFALGLWDPYKFRFGFRLLAAVVFVFCCWYLMDAITGRSRLFEASGAAIVFGYPSLRFALTGRFSWRNEPDDDWIRLLGNARDTAMLSDLFQQVRCTTDEIDAHVSVKTLISAEVVAAMKHAPNVNLADSLNKWASQHREEWTTDLNLIAIEAIDRVEHNSQLRQGWEDDGEEEEWHRRIKTVREALRRNI